jgi:alpha-beta hydrolase superfamily lysophospholipase
MRSANRLVRLCLAAALLVSGCAPTLQRMGSAQTDPHFTDGAYVAADGTALPLRRWLPQGPPRAVIVALHGFNDYSKAFDKPGQYWAARQIATFAYDQRGFGRAQPRGIWASSETLTADALGAAAAARAQFPGVPVYLLGESMGGAVLMAALAAHAAPTAQPDGLAGAILVAPAVWARDTMPVYQRVALWVTSYTVPWLAVRPPPGLKIRASDNIEMLRAMGRDPLVIHDTRIDALHGLTDLMDSAMSSAARFQMRSLVLFGAHEEVIPKKPLQQVLAELPRTGPRTALYPNGFHMLLRDLGAEVVLADIASWVTDPGAPLPSGYERGGPARMTAEAHPTGQGD